MAKSKPEILLLTIRGKDTPGITSALMGVLAEAHTVKMLDIEQTVVHKKLLLSILVQFPRGNGTQNPLLKELLFIAKKLGVDLNFEVFDSSLLGEENTHHQYVITCLGDDVGSEALAVIAKALAMRKVNIDRISKLTLKNISAVELITHAKRPIDPKKLSRELLSLSTKIGIDIAIQKHDWLRRAKRLVMMDMDSTLVQQEVIDQLAKEAGVYKKVAAITERAMHGAMPFTKSLKERVWCLRGTDVEVLERVYRHLKLTPGAERLVRVLKKLGFKVGVVSGGFTYFTNRLQEKLDLDYVFANQLEIKNGQLTGHVTGPVVDAQRKALILTTVAQGEKISLDQTIAIGDGANDIPMLTRAGLGIAFHAKPKVRKKAHFALTHHGRLDSVLYLLGISEREIATLDY